MTISEQVIREQWLVMRLSQFGDGGPDLSGLTTADERKQRVRQYIEKQCGRTRVVAHRKINDDEKTPVTAEEAFFKVFKEPL